MQFRVTARELADFGEVEVSPSSARRDGGTVKKLGGSVGVKCKVGLEHKDD